MLNSPKWFRRRALAAAAPAQIRSAASRSLAPEGDNPCHHDFDRQVVNGLYDPNSPRSPFEGTCAALNVAPNPSHTSAPSRIASTTDEAPRLRERTAMTQPLTRPTTRPVAPCTGPGRAGVAPSIRL